MQENEPVRLRRHGSETPDGHTGLNAHLTDQLATGCHSFSLPDNGRSRAEFMMNSNSEDTWISAASTGFKKPSAARTTPTPSTARVPAKLTMMIRRHRRA